MYARKTTVSMFALVFCLAVTGLSMASDSPQPAPDAAQGCCAHKGKGAESASHCDHKAGGKSAEEKACCAKHAAKQKDGDKSESCCCCDACDHGAKKAEPAKS